MAGKIIIEKIGNNVTIASGLQGQELYEAYVAFTAKLASELKDKNEIMNISSCAVKDALTILDSTNQTLTS